MPVPARLRLGVGARDLGGMRPGHGRTTHAMKESGSPAQRALALANEKVPNVLRCVPGGASSRGGLVGARRMTLAGLLGTGVLDSARRHSFRAARPYSCWYGEEKTTKLT